MSQKEVILGTANVGPETSEAAYTIEIFDLGGSHHVWTDASEPLYNPNTDMLTFDTPEGKRIVVFSPGKVIVTEQ